MRLENTYKDFHDRENANKRRNQSKQSKFRREDAFKNSFVLTIKITYR